MRGEGTGGGRTFASLGSSLLARKGSARPAMRPQGLSTDVSDDLGWNDMGGAPVPRPSPTIRLPAMTGTDPRDVPPVVVQHQAAIARAFAGSAAPATARRSAFTLRLDAERHLRLRLACAVENRSAQQIVTQALDELLAAGLSAGRTE